VLTTLLLRPPARARLPTLCAAALVAALSMITTTGQAPGDTPTVRLATAPRHAMPGAIDSNTPVMWSLVDGTWLLSAMTSFAGIPALATSTRLDTLPSTQPVIVLNHPGHGVWLESIVEDDHGVWYGYFHHEVPADACGRPDRQIPSIGAIRSEDRGHVLTYLGIVLEAQPDSYACGSSNRYVMGGVGDVSAVLDHDRQDLFLYYSQYPRDARRQGVAVARLAWADRDAPTGKASIWDDGAWIPAILRQSATDDAPATWVYAPGTPLVPATRSWHDGDGQADAFWGAAIHWNTYLGRWVMLLNRARNERFDQDGIYISYSLTLSDPRRWSTPRKLLNGGGWYPQVVGLEAGEGTDKRAGQHARFYLTGKSDFFIEFSR
jgi:hypothetical protein